MRELKQEALAGESGEAPPGRSSALSPPRPGRDHKTAEADASATQSSGAPPGSAGTAEFEDLEIPGRGAPPPAHGGWEVPPSTQPVWSLPSGAIAGHDSATRNRPLVPPLTPSLGQEGKRRSPVAVMALSVLTLGVYALVWHHRVNVEVADFDTRMFVRSARSTLAVAVAWGIGLLVSIAGAVLIVTSQMHVALPYEPPVTLLERFLLLGGLVVIPYVILVLPFSLIAMVMTLERVRIVEDRVGRTSDMQMRPVASVWWLAVPIAGGLILQSIVQRRLNRVWESVAPPARISEY